MKKNILFYLLLIGVPPAFGQTYRNLDFSQTCDTSKTGFCYWQLSWGSKGSSKPAIVNGNQCLQLNGDFKNSVSFVEQECEIKETAKRRVLELSAKIRTENVVGGGVDLNIAIYDKAGKFLTNKDMSGYASLGRITGSNEYKTYTLKALLPAGAGKIRIGAIMYGMGKAMYDDFKVSLLAIESQKPSELAKRYITAACDTIALHSLVKDSINIKQLKKQALQIAGPAKNYEDCHLAIDYLISSLRPFGELHSFFMTAGEVAKWSNDTTRIGQIEFPSHKIIGAYGYLSIPKFDGGNDKLIRAYTDSIQETIRNFTEKKIKGWIIDLRQDMGGNMAPMIAGLGPLFSADTLGFLVNAQGIKDPWAYSDYKKFVRNPDTLQNRLPIAVLTGHNAGSSGEIVVISFIGNARTKSFGQPTWGLTTGNGQFDLPGGGRMMLASTRMADRNGKMYIGPVVPDIFITNDSSDGSDKVLVAAIEWLRSQSK